MLYLGIDLGGTNIAAAAVDGDGTIVSRAALPTPRGVEPVAAAMAQAAREAAAAAGVPLPDIAAVGVGVPGTVDPDRGIIHYWSNLDFRDVPIARLLEDRLGRSVWIENDANAAAQIGRASCRERVYVSV